jgi:tRNA A37 threonylcarbamoyladenosine modification protein TsaB
MLILNINTSDNEIIELSLEREGIIIKNKKIKAHRSQAEKLLPAIEKLILSAKTELSFLKKIKVEHRGSSFTSLRIGVLTANALAYALNIPVETFVPDKKNIKKINNFNIVTPKYDRDPDIKIKTNEYF